MKIVWRILIILLAGLLVSGATYGFTRTDLAGELLGGPGGDAGEHQRGGDFVGEHQQPGGGERPEGEDNRQNFEGAPPDGGFDRQARGRDHHGGNSGGWNFRTTIKNLEIIGAIIAGVVLLSLLWKQGKQLYKRFRAKQVAPDNATI